MLFDLLRNCDPMNKRAKEGRLGFRINHEMVGKINKTLDLVVTTKRQPRSSAQRRTFAGLVDVYGIVLEADEADELNGLPPVEEDQRGDVFEVAIAMEAKACMTEHLKSLPRLHAEVLATGYLAKKAAPHCISVSYSLVNAASTFHTPSDDGRGTNQHSQPDAARRVVEMLSTAIPTTGEAGHYGYDAIGVTVIDCKNDGSPVTVVTEPPAPSTLEHVHYERMINLTCSAFRAKY